jgi:hypothetical protein
MGVDGLTRQLGWLEGLMVTETLDVVSATTYGSAREIPGLLAQAKAGWRAAGRRFLKARGSRGV